MQCMEGPEEGALSGGHSSLRTDSSPMAAKVVPPTLGAALTAPQHPPCPGVQARAVCNAMPPGASGWVGKGHWDPCAHPPMIVSAFVIDKPPQILSPGHLCAPRT